MTIAEYRQKWDSAFLLPGESDNVRSAIRELAEYFPAYGAEEIEERFWNATRLFSEYWMRRPPDAKSERSLIDFYNSTDLEIFELMHYHGVLRDEGPLNYVCALDLAERLGCRDVLDYGSGAGSGGLLFAKAGLAVTLCDVSLPLLEFARWRFRKRAREAEFIDLRTGRLATRADLITCFEVLEHAPDPLLILRKCREVLRDGGYLILTAPFGKDPERPMHIIHDPRLKLKFRAQGFEIRRDLKAQVRNRCHEPFFVLQKVNRPFAGNLACLIGDFYLRGIVGA
ncbi:MAG TPA: class I SAM-dependent methyltransferase [Candidatus Omnitrophota bacterium]|nr:class I SAM-dependent methyltransferase [Candidatus Omnitrophota bacterium]